MPGNVLPLSPGNIRGNRLTVATAFIESTLFSKYTFTPVDGEDELLLQVNLHAFSECLSMFSPTSGGQQTGSKGLDGRNVFAPIKGSVRLVYEGDGQPFLVMYLPTPSAAEVEWWS